MENYMKLEILAIGENESFARSAVAAFALPLNPTLSELSDIKTAVSEAVTNCVVHAYAGMRSNAKIVIECRAHQEETYGILHITVTDEGCGIDDIAKATAPFFTTLAEGERSGMGFTIMQTFMDEFSVESATGQGTRVHMSKRVGYLEDGLERKRVDA